MHLKPGLNTGHIEIESQYYLHDNQRFDLFPGSIGAMLVTTSTAMTTTTQTTDKICGNCAFWHASETGSQGECRVRPPQAIAFHVDDETTVKTLFPVTSGQDWCGEFEVR